MNELKRLSIIVPTYNRQAYIERQIKYWQGLPVTLYILDGSEKPLPFSKSARLPDNILYYHMPCSITERLKCGADLVITPYVMLLGDDEFSVPSAIIQCIKELDDDSGLISCMGLAARFWRGPQNKVLARDSYQRLKDYKVNGDSAAERMAYHMNPYICSTIYSVMRSHVWIKNIELMAKSHYSAPVISELQFELSSCCQGKSKVINELMWLRSGENPPVSLKDWNRKIDYLMWYGGSQYSMEREEFITAFVNHFASNGSFIVSRKDVEEALLQLNNYLQQRNVVSNVRSRSSSALSILRDIIIRLSPRLVRMMRQAVNYMHYYISDDSEIRRFAAEMDLRESCSVDIQAVSKIEKVIREFRLNNISIM